MQVGTEYIRQQPFEIHGIEKRATQVPSNAYLWLGGLAIVGSAVLKALKQDSWSLFVGQWAPTLFVLGTLTQLVKSTTAAPEPPFKH